jgi:hypothetical protein
MDTATTNISSVLASHQFSHVDNRSQIGPEMTGIVEEIQRILAGIQYHYVSFDVLTGISCIVPIVLCCESRPPTDAEKQTMLNACVM